VDTSSDFAEYVAEKRPALLRAARAICGDPDLAEDLLQASLARVLPRWTSLREPGAADAYVRRAMLNQFRSWCRQPWRSRERATDDVPEPHPRWAKAPEPEELDVWPMVAALPRQQRSAVVLRFYEGLSVAETSAVLRCSSGTVKSNTSRGLASLRRLAG
jgi:RNA polymerase sigma-70 factor (sigma-E family)